MNFIACLAVFTFTILNTAAGAEFQCYHCQFTPDKSLNAIISQKLGYPFNETIAEECATNPQSDFLGDVPGKDEDDEDDSDSTTSQPPVSTTTTEEDITETDSTTKLKRIIRKRDIVDKLGTGPVRAETSTLYCIIFKATSKTGDHPVVIRGGFTSQDEKQDGQTVSEKFDTYPVEKKWKEFFTAVGSEVKDPKLYMCAQSECNGSGATSVIGKSSDFSFVVMICTGILFSKFELN